jgi:ABC-type multidrug transport system ATPase subunit
MAIVISSHMLRDIEPVVDRIICLERGRVMADDGLDELKERYAEWIVTSPSGRLPAQFAEPWVVSARGDAHRARLVVRHADVAPSVFADTHDATVQARPLGLEALFPLLVNGAELGGTDGAAGGSATARSARSA